MACNCGQGNKTVEAYQVRWPNGTVKRYATEAEARTAAEHSEGAFEVTRRPA